MTYKDYIDLGFIRFDYIDSVVFDRIGFNAFYLKFILSKTVNIEVYSDKLYSPYLVITKEYPSVYRLPITNEQIIELIKQKQ